ncbi:acetylornithine deacetylase [Sphingomonas oleivorans]|uniref:Acetylornithine deacetylase n=1 Tax=Sphingomonas oleivorans TaxID=1735121 RepID=A0A2T5FW36_9SPHN|nr:acetylornithine deacetylase [Sphingomonas oleivorans]PTQ09985.1 acetylornithine deacetylase [Sphingomonas oleivorans]
MAPDPATLALLADLIAFDTVSARSNRALIDHAAAWLATRGITAEVLPSEDGEKASLWATIGPHVDGGIVLSGHSDVVPVEGQDWSSDPFRLDIRDGRAFGRGVADMKGFIACALSAAARLNDAPLKRPIHVALTYDEEVGCIGAPKLLDWLSRQAPRPAIAFIGEPTSMQVVNAHKGIVVARTDIRGVEAHSSLAHQGVSAIGLAARAITLLQRIEAELAVQVRDARFEPDRTTISVNRIGGGTAANILAGHAWFEWDIRSIPGVDVPATLARFRQALEEEVIAPARALHPGVSAATLIVADAPALAPEEDGAAEALATRLLGTNRAVAVPYAAEAGQFQRAGLSTVIVGPGSIEQAHKADEYASLDQLARCEQFLDRLGAELSR